METELLLRGQSALGLAVFAGLAWLMSEERRQVGWRLPAIGVAMQVTVAALMLHLPFIAGGFALVGDAVNGLQAATEAGTSLVFGYLGGGPTPFEEVFPEHGVILAFRILPMVIFISALSSLLFYWGVLPALVRLLARLIERPLQMGGAASFATMANVFLGMVDAPLTIRPYMARLTHSELFVVMTAGMATIAGTTYVLYAIVLAEVLPGVAGHLLVASIISVPAAVMMARLMVPETEAPTPADDYQRSEAHGAIDSIVQGAGAGLQLLLNIIALLITVLALVALVDAFLGLLPDIGGAPLSLDRMLGWLMAPLAWLTGVAADEAAQAGALLGTKVFLTELVAYIQMAALPEGTLSPRSNMITIYALCGFANFAGLGILIGGLSAVIPERRAEIGYLGLKSLIAGTLATLSTGAAVGLVG
ncbi:MAG: nucleoside:proton symporter [Gammaproteobacteria bacterium AqS3]|nr:nucleoside:proton symporter [Gammaproteobacteria bacterium AqS3]